MGRRRSHAKQSQPAPKEKKKGKSMHQNLLGYNNAVNTGPIIKDELSFKHFGILLSTQQAVEEFQEKSGMRKAFTTEYQYHYWALVARVTHGDEILDIAIPTVMFNYRQQVSGAAVSFHLNDVEAASNATAELAGIYANVLATSSFAEYLTATFGNVEWMNVPMNTCHVHPGMMSTFSGTDYAKTVSDPGICFPLSEPQMQPSFSSIICHDTSRKNIAKVVRTEYRFANRDGNTISYKHGQCVSYWAGYEGKTKEVTYSPFQALFKNKTNEVVFEVEPYDGYVTIDGANTVVKDNTLMLEIFDKFDELNFSPNTDNILKENIVTATKTYYGAVGTHQGANKTTYTQPPSIPYMERICIDAGYDEKSVKAWTWKQLNDFYKTVCEVEELAKSNPNKKQVKDLPDEIKAIHMERMRVSHLHYNDKKNFLVEKKVATFADLNMISMENLELKIEDYFDECEEEAEMKILRASKAATTTDGELIEEDEDDEEIENLIIALPLDEKCKYLLSFGIGIDQIRGQTEAQINGLILGLIREFDTGHEDENEIVDDLKDIKRTIDLKNVGAESNSVTTSEDETPVKIRVSESGNPLPEDPKNNKSVRTFLINFGVAPEIFESLSNDEIYALLDEFNW